MYVRSTFCKNKKINKEKKRKEKKTQNKQKQNKQNKTKILGSLFRILVVIVKARFMDFGSKNSRQMALALIFCVLSLHFRQHHSSNYFFLTHWTKRVCRPIEARKLNKDTLSQSCLRTFLNLNLFQLPFSSSLAPLSPVPPSLSLFWI